MTLHPYPSELRKRSGIPLSTAIISKVEKTTQQSKKDSLLKRSLKELKSSEVCIHGKIYSLENFDHPGGNSIQIYGGNDVTVQYHMMHPYHTPKHLEKMECVGIATDYQMDYKFDTEFEREIKKEVFKIVRRGREFATMGFLLRCLFYVCFFMYTQYMWVSRGSSVKMAFLLGLAQAWIGLNVQHDANHGAVSRNPILNDILGFGASFIGGDKWLWMEQHTTHHAFCNHSEKDPDSFSGEPILLFNDYPLNHPSRRFHHRFQSLFFIPVMSFYWLSSVFNPQILDLRHRGPEEVGISFENDFAKSRVKYAVMIRLLYIYLNAITPFYFHSPFTALFHIWIMAITESLILSLLFSLSHNFEHSDRDPTSEFRLCGKRVCWFKSQVETSSTYGGAISGYLTGGLNFQVEHHLFPRMSSAWYPYIAPTVRRICKKHGVRYSYYPWITQNLISTFKYIHCAGTGGNWDMDLMQPLSGKN